MIYNTFDLVVDISRELGVDGDKYEKWFHILQHLSGFTTQERNGKTVFRYTEKGTAWWGDNTLGIQQIYPGNTIGLASEPKLLEVSRNTIDVMNRWKDFNGTNSFFPAAVRIGYDPDVIIDKLQGYCLDNYPNGFKKGNPHGIENYSTVPNTVNMMLCMSHVPVGIAHIQGSKRKKQSQRPESLIRLFPVWPRDKDARFANIRCWGAFLVSSEMKNGAVKYVKLYSEQGRDCIIVNPWPEQKVIIYQNGKAIKTLSGQRINFKTDKDSTYILAPIGVSYNQAVKLLNKRILTQTAVPRIEPDNTFLFKSQTISITSADRNAEIYYTTDGSMPESNSILYTKPFKLRGSTVVKAIALAPGHKPSPVVSATLISAESGSDLVNRFDVIEDFDRIITENGYPTEAPRWIDKPGQAVRNPNPGKQGILAVHPLSQAVPCVIKRFVELPSDKTAKLRIVTSGDPYQGSADYAMQAGVSDGKEVIWFEKEIVSAGPKPTTKGWSTFEYDLSDYAGQRIIIMVKAGSGGKHPWHNDRAYFDEISVIVKN